MGDSVEYQVFIGFNDYQMSDELVKEHELIELITNFFTRKKIDFSILRAKGGYIYDNGQYITESNLCINIIGDSQLDIIKLTKSLGMYMNQQCSLIIKNPVRAMFN